MAEVSLVNKMLVDRIGNGDVNCVLCVHEEETFWNLFKECLISQAMTFASQWYIILDLVA